MPKKQFKVKSKKLHVEIAPVNWDNIKREVDSFNHNPERNTLSIKPDHVINDALRMYLEMPNRITGA